jgi:hypothetical protein
MAKIGHASVDGRSLVLLVMAGGNRLDRAPMIDRPVGAAGCTEKRLARTECRSVVNLNLAKLRGVPLGGVRPARVRPLPRLSRPAFSLSGFAATEARSLSA